MENLAKNMQRTIIQMIDYFHTPFRTIIPLETFKYAATGGLNTVLDISLYFICYNFVLDKHIVDLQIIAISPHIAAFLIVFPVTFFTGFLFIRYMISVSGSIFLNYVFLKLLVEFAGIWPTLAKLITTCIVVIYSYFIQRFYTFKTANLVTSYKVMN